VPDQSADLPGLERRRRELYRGLGQVGEFRRGPLNEVRRRCGKPNCACAQPVPTAIRHRPAATASVGPAVNQRGPHRRSGPPGAFNDDGARHSGH
jgi:Family of unknown function (DUF6788)